MPNQIIIADTSSLIALTNINQLELLKFLYEEIYITKEVFDEYSVSLPQWVNIVEVKDTAKIKILQLELDKGEASAIALALEKENALLIIDERKGRRVAQSLKLRITGVLGILVKAKRSGHINYLKPFIDELTQKGFRISEMLITKVLSEANEL